MTVRQISALAGVSTRTLYQLFPGGKQECLLSAYHEAVRGTARRVAIAHLSDGDVDGRLARALEAFAEELRERPQMARFALVDVFAAGESARERSEHTQQLFEGMVNLNFRGAGGAAPPPLLVKGVVAGLARVARARVLEDRVAVLPASVEELLEWTRTYRSPAAAQLRELRGSILPHVLSPTVTNSFGGPARCDADEKLILDAVLELMAREGRADFGAARISAAAGVPRRRFEALFTSAQACLFASLEQHAARTLAAAGAAFIAGGSWPEGLPHALASLCARLAAEPRLAHLALVQTLALGPDGVRFRERLLDRFATSLRASAPPDQRPSALVAEASAGAIWGVLYHHVAHDATQQIGELVPDLSFLALAPVLGSTGAIEAIVSASSVSARKRGSIGAQLLDCERDALSSLHGPR